MNIEVFGNDVVIKHHRSPTKKEREDTPDCFEIVEEVVLTFSKDSQFKITSDVKSLL